MLRPSRLSILTLCGAMFAAVVLAAAPADAGPKWRLRRWATRPPIDPTIRSTIEFGRRGVTPAYRTPRAYRSPRTTYGYQPVGRRGYRVIGY